MRVGFILLPLLLCAAPAFAQAAESRPPQIADPLAAARIADSVQALSKALLDLHVGNLQAALEGRETTPPDRDLTVRDLARRNDPNFERHLDQRIAATRPQIEQGIRAVNEVVPQVTEDLRRAQKSVERAIANMPDPNYPKR